MGLNDSRFLNNAAHGYVIIPILLAIRNKGLFTYLENKDHVSLETLCKDLHLHPGPLQIILKQMKGLDFVSVEKGVVRLINNFSLKQEIDLIPSDLLHLYSIEPHLYLREAKDPLFLPFLSAEWNSSLENFLHGCALIPLLVSFYLYNREEEQGSGRLSVSLLGKIARMEISYLFSKYGWGELDGEEIVLTEIGKWVYEHALNYGLGLSYRPLLSRIDDLLSGDCSSVFTNLNNGDEAHVDRTLNVLASGSMHKAYFKTTLTVFRDIFNHPDILNQPAYIIDTGCGDGTFLNEIYEYIKQHTLRGKHLSDFPCIMVGIDYNQAALTETAKRLTSSDIPHIVIHGDIGNPAQILTDLKNSGVKFSKRVVHIRSFLDHDRPYFEPVSKLEFSSTGAFMKRTGEEIPCSDVLSNLQEHLYRWKEILKPEDDLMILEVHSLDPSLAFEIKESCISLHFDLLQALSGQLLVSANEFLTASVQASLVSNKCFRFPEEGYTRITFNHFKTSRNRSLSENLSIEENNPDLEGFESHIELSQDALFYFIKEELGSMTNQSITLESSLLSLGLDSLELGRLARKLKSRFKIQVSLPTIFKNPCIQNLIKNLTKKEDSPINKTEADFFCKDEGKKHPLSLSQEPMWIWFELIGDSSAYNVPRIEHYKGSFSQDSFVKALLLILRRHPIIRTKYGVENGVPYQQVIPLLNYSLPLTIRDLRKNERKRESAYQLIEREINVPFDLENGETFRILLLTLEDDEYVLVITMHHIITDGSSIPVFWNELVTAYNGFLQNVCPILPVLSCTYFDWVTQQKKHFVKEHLNPTIQYWKECLQGELPILDLPVDFPYPKQQTFNGSRLNFVFTEEEASALYNICRQANATLFMGILAAWGAFLCRHSHQLEIVIGTPWANRDEEELQNLIGCFVNTLPLRLKMPRGASFIDLIKEAKNVALQAFEHGSLPFHKIVEALNIHSKQGRLPIYQTMLALEEENGWIRGDVFQGMERVENKDALKAIRDTSKFEISLSVREKVSDRGKYLTGELVYNSDLFADSTAERMKERFLVFCKNLFQYPSLDFWNIQLISKRETQHLLENLNRTDFPLPEAQSVFDLFEDQVRISPSALAIKWKGGSYTYSQFWEKIQQFTAYLIKQGISRGDHVGIMMERSPEQLISLFSVMQTGAVYVPIDPEYPIERQKFILEDADIDFLIKHGHLYFSNLPITVIDYIETASSQNPVLVRPQINDCVYILYTSGTTGLPKGVRITHQNLLNDIWHIIQKQIPREDLKLTLFSTNICFDQSVEEIYAPLSCGGAILLVESTLDLWRDEAVTLIVTTPSQISYVLNDPIPSTVRALVLGGELLPQLLVDRIFENTSIQRIYNSYGPTECTDQATVCVLTRENRKISLGRPISNVKVYILDNNLQLLPQGVFGELCIGGAGVGSGYYNRHELTNAKFFPNPFGKGVLYRTGDVAKWNAEEVLEFIGRNDDQIKIHGVRIEKGEIENVILKYPDVSAACLITKHDEHNKQHLVAYVTPETVNPEALKKHCKTFLSIHMIPHWIVPLSTFPLTINGKLDIKSLPSPFSAKIVQKSEKPTHNSQVVLNTVLQLFKNILKVEDFSPETSFFAAGGHSLLVIQLLAQIQNLFDKRMRMREFLEHDTPASLSEWIEKNREIPSICIAQDEGTLPDNREIPEGGSSILIIGAGIAGIMSGIECLHRGIPFQIIEKSNGFGGIWLNGCNEESKLQTTSHVYLVDKAISHKDVYPNRAEMLKYLDGICKYYNLEKYTHFHTEVETVCRDKKGFSITTVHRENKQRKVLNHDGILVCSGKHHTPHIPQWEALDGVPHIVHASCLANISMSDKEVVIVGGGSFAVEALRIAHQRGAKKVTLLARKSYWVLPTFADTVLHSGIDPQLKLSSDYNELTKKLEEWLIEYYVQFGITHFIPMHRSFDAHISTSDEFFQIVKEKHVFTRIGEIEFLKKDGIVLKTKEFIPADLIIAATGYKDPQFPFLDSLESKKPIVYKGFMLSTDPRIGFVGFLDMVTSATAVIPLNLELCLKAMANRRYRPRRERIEHWLQETPEDLISNVKSHISWLHEEKEYLDSHKSYLNLSELTDFGNKFYPERLALVKDDKIVTYRELHERALGFSSFLSQKKYKTVLAFLPETIEAFIVLLGMIKRGCRVILTHEISDFTKLNINEKIDLFILTKKKAIELRNSLDLIGDIYLLDGEQNQDHFTGPVEIMDGEWIFWTSGSTGKPKGVVHTYRSLSIAVENFGLTAWSNYQEPPRLLFYNHLSHLGGFMSSFSTLSKGGTVILATYKPENVLTDIERFRPNLLVLMTSWFTELSSKISFEMEIFKCLKNIVLGGEPIPPCIEEKIKHYPVSFTFGISECGPLFMRRIGDSIPNALDHPLPGVSYYVNKEKESDPIGELWVKSNSLFKGYYGSCEHQEWFKTGDLVATGARLIYRGRKEDQIGENLFVHDIEDALLNKFSFQKVAVSFENGILYVLVNDPSDMKIHSTKVQNWLLQKYPSFKSIVSIQQNSLSSITGKISRRLLKQVVKRPKVLLFPGQGVQHLGMFDNLRDHPFFQQACEILGCDLFDLFSRSPEEFLSRTDICQTAIYTASMIELFIQIEQDPLFLSECQFGLGLSLGEYTALTAAGGLSFVDGLKILTLRGTVMQEACTLSPQAMLSISHLSREKILCCLSDFEGLFLANDLSPEHVVIGGDRFQCEKILEWAKHNGGHAVLLKVAGAFHTPFMMSAAKKLASAINAIFIQRPRFPIFSNFDGETTIDPEQIKFKLIKQLDHPVCFSKSLSYLSDAGICLEQMFEAGPKKTVTNIIKEFQEVHHEAK